MELGPVHTSPQGVSSMWVILNQADINRTVQSIEIQNSVHCTGRRLDSVTLLSLRGTGVELGS